MCEPSQEAMRAARGLGEVVGDLLNEVDRLDPMSEVAEGARARLNGWSVELFGESLWPSEEERT